MTRINQLFFVYCAAILAVFLIFPGLVSAAASPSASTSSANLTAPRNVALNAAVNPNGGDTQAWFDLGRTNSFGDSRGHQYIGNGTSIVNFKAGIINLELNTEYFYRAVAQNNQGTSFGETRSFRTGSSDNSGSSGSEISSTTTIGTVNSFSGSLPETLANGPASVSSNSAVLNGSVKANNVPTNFWFEFGPASSLGTQTTTGSAGNSNSWQLVEGAITGLQPGTTYYYRVTAQNSYGTSYGSIVSFTTPVSKQTPTTTAGIVKSSNTGNPQTATAKPAAATSNTGTGNIQASTNAKTGTSELIPSRPSFISLEYSLENSGALVITSDNLKPKPGDEFSYSIVYKNENPSVFKNAGLKIILPPEVEYAYASKEISKISGNMIELNLGDINPDDSDAVVITVLVKEDSKVGTTMVFTAVLKYSDTHGTQLATTSYLTAGIGWPEDNLSAFSVGSFLGAISNIWLVTFGLLVLMSSLIYWLAKASKNGKYANGFIRGDAGNNFSAEDVHGTGLDSTGRPDSLNSEPVGLPLVERVVR